MLVALKIWSRYPTQIESDLSMFHRRSIKDWHQGTMSSRLLLSLLWNLPDHSSFKTYARPPFGRGGRWSEAEQVAAYVGNKLARLRADYVIVNGGEEHEPEFLIDPTDRIAAVQDAAEAAVIDGDESPGGLGSLWHLQDNPDIFE